MNQTELNKLKSDLESDLDITDDNVLDKSLRVPHLYQKYLSYYIKESIALKKMKVELDEFYGKAIEELVKGPLKLSKGEMDHFVEGNKEYCDKRRSYYFQEQCCVFLENSVQNVKNLSFNIKNFIDLKIFLQGGK